ncbi:MAG: tryptophan--tRNA ligase [Kiritimatiellae bacterium]|jgi:tryptophanyl-tRNA synthetase|nr:tryptophan--tRNA ligase [Kiritimatiellia bacterium]
MRILSGIQPSGKLHIGNYFGMMKPALELQEKGEAFLFIADYHALTTSKDPAELKQNTTDVALDFLACGLDPTRTTFFRQSDIPRLLELTWMLSTITPLGLLERCHSYKDKVAKGITPTHALFSYPVLMAADILAYQSNIVPVGRDQKQHLEVTRDLAIKFNNEYGDIFTIPEASIQESVAVVPGIDGQKMSKSYDNHILLFDGKKATKKRIMKIITDSKELEDPKDPDTCNVYLLYKLFAEEQKVAEMADNLRKGGYGYGHAKKQLFEDLWEYMTPFRENREKLEQDLDYVNDVLIDGAKRASKVADKTFDAAKKAIGL